MRLTRLIAGSVTAGLLGLVPIALTAPAAQASVTTNLQVQSSYKSLTFGMKTSVRAAVTATDETGFTGAVRVGTVQLQSKVKGKSWKTIKTEPASSYVSFGQVKPKEHTQYRISYSGGSDTYGNVFPAGVSKATKVKVKRKITAPKKGFTLKGKVSPKYAKKKIVVKVSTKPKKGFKKYKTIKTNKKGRYKLKLPKRRGVHFYKVTVKKDKRFGGTSYTWRTRVF